MKLKALAVLIGAVGAAAAILFAVPAGFGRALADPAVAALAPETLEGLFLLALFGLLAIVALLGARLTGRRIALGDAPGRALALGTALGLGGIGAALALANVAGSTQLGLPPQTATRLLVTGSLLVLLQALAEEIYFRGWLQPALAAEWGRWPALLVSSAAFALLHFINATSDPMGLLNLALTGLWLGLLAERSGGVALPVAAHFGWNWAQQMLFGAAPNPGTGNFGALIDVELVGSPWWGGSAAGLTSSAAMTFALAALIVAVLTWPASDGRPAARLA